MNGRKRAAATLLGTAVAGALLWLAAQVGQESNGGYWGAAALVACAGLALAVTQVRGRSGHPPAMLGISFVPVFVAAGWALFARQPDGSWVRDHVLAWSGDLGIRGVVLDVGMWMGVLAFGIGYTFGLALEPRPRRVPGVEPVERPAVEPATTHELPAADEPLTAERRELAEREPVTTHPAR